MSSRSISGSMDMSMNLLLRWEMIAMAQPKTVRRLIRELENYFKMG